MSDTTEPTANQHQNTLSGADLDAQIAADEAARQQPEPEVVEPPEPVQEPEPAESDGDFEKRIARLGYEKRAAERVARQLQERLDRLEGKAPPLEKDAEITQLVEQRASELAKAQAYNDKANKIYQDGVKDFPDFELKLAGLRDIGGISPALVEAADELGDAHKIIHYLARNLDEAEKILTMTPHRMGVALAKVATKLNPPAVQSKAPAPIRPIVGHGRVEQSVEDMPLDEYMRKEDERWASRYRR